MPFVNLCCYYDDLSSTDILSILLGGLVYVHRYNNGCIKNLDNL